MHRFLIGLILPFVAAIGVSVWTHGRFGMLRPSEWAALTLLLLVTPLLAAGAAAALVHIRRPRRWLIARGRGRLRAGSLGVLAGLTALALIGVLLFANYLHRVDEGFDVPWYEVRYETARVPEVAIVALCSFLPALVLVWVMPRPRPGVCIQCGYDLRRSLDYGRCPECGREIATA